MSKLKETQAIVNAGIKGLDDLEANRVLLTDIALSMAELVDGLRMKIAAEKSMFDQIKRP